MKDRIKQLIEKYEIKLKTIRDLIKIADAKTTDEGIQDLDKYEAVERFLKKMINDLKLLNLWK